MTKKSMASVQSYLAQHLWPFVKSKTQITFWYYCSLKSNKLYFGSLFFCVLYNLKFSAFGVRYDSLFGRRPRIWPQGASRSTKTNINWVWIIWRTILREKRTPEVFPLNCICTTNKPSFPFSITYTVGGLIPISWNIRPGNTSNWELSVLLCLYTCY